MRIIVGQVYRYSGVDRWRKDQLFLCIQSQPCLEPEFDHDQRMVCLAVDCVGQPLTTSLIFLPRLEELEPVEDIPHGV
jgi:hypothetical protein